MSAEKAGPPGAIIPTPELPQRGVECPPSRDGAGPMIYLAPAVNVESALYRYQSVKKFIEAALRSGVDYGPIPGTDKPTLLKPGAEKLGSFFGLVPTFEIIEQVVDWSGKDHDGEPFFYFWYRCSLWQGSRLAAQGDGSANSWEKKYRWRNAERVCPSCGRAAIIKSKAEYGGGWLCHLKRGGCGKKFADSDPAIVQQTLGPVKNPDIYDIVNTLQKMGMKRAFVAAVLLAANGSEYFTQDVEDFYPGEFYDAPDQTAHGPARSAAPASSSPSPQPPPPNDPIPPADVDAGTPPPSHAEPPAVPPTGSAGMLVTIGKGDQKTKVPKAWLDAPLGKWAPEKVSTYEIEGILLKLRLPPTTPIATVTGAIDIYLNARKDPNAPATGEEALAAARTFLLGGSHD